MLVSLDFNIGPKNFTNGNPVLDYLNEGDYEKVAGSFWVWRRSGGKILGTLVKRREQEALKFNNGQPVTNVSFDGVQPPAQEYVL